MPEQGGGELEGPVAEEVFLEDLRIAVRELVDDWRTSVGILRARHLGGRGGGPASAGP